MPDTLLSLSSAPFCWILVLLVTSIISIPESCIFSHTLSLQSMLLMHFARHESTTRKSKVFAFRALSHGTRLLHDGVSRAPASFRNSPPDVLSRVFDVTRLRSRRHVKHPLQFERTFQGRTACTVSQQDKLPARFQESPPPVVQVSQ